MSPAVTRSGSRRTGMLGAFALLEADEQKVRSLATSPKADGYPELLAALACDLETPGTYARIGEEFAALTAVGTSNWRDCLTVIQPCFVWIFCLTFLSANACFCLIPWYLLFF